MCPPKGTKIKDKQTGRSLYQNDRGFINYRGAAAAAGGGGSTTVGGANDGIKNVGTGVGGTRGGEGRGEGYNPKPVKEPLVNRNGDGRGSTRTLGTAARKTSLVNVRRNGDGAGGR